MNDIIKRIDEVVELIDMLAELIAGGTRVTNDELINLLSNNLLQLFPDIVDSYEEEALMPYAEEVEYWVMQLERLIQALQGDDKFLLYDVLVYEIKQNLLEYRERIKSIA